MQLVKKSNHDVLVLAALEKLFILQDRKYTKEQIKLYADEIKKYDFTYDDIIRGIEKLYKASLVTVPCNIVIESIENNKTRQYNDYKIYEAHAMTKEEIDNLFKTIDLKKKKYGKNWFKFDK